jgi:hypothetical protein
MRISWIDAEICSLIAAGDLLGVHTDSAINAAGGCGQHHYELVLNVGVKIFPRRALLRGIRR